jgi:hypothetical protein
VAFQGLALVAMAAAGPFLWGGAARADEAHSAVRKVTLDEALAYSEAHQPSLRVALGRGALFDFARMAALGRLLGENS